MTFGLVHELAAEFDVAATCRVLKVSQSGYYDWRNRRPSERRSDDSWLVDVIRQVYQDSPCAGRDTPAKHIQM